MLGTKEWSSVTINLPQAGCEHDCRYCYARDREVRRFKRMKPDQWGTPRPRKRKDESKYRRKYQGVVMTPSSHDITPNNVESFIGMLRMLLEAGNRVLVVSKPHLSCIKRICGALPAKFKKQVLFRFTIGAMENRLLRYWDRNAPLFWERHASLRHAHDKGWATSVSCEPNLCGMGVIKLFHHLKPLVTETIWIGKLNDYKNRVKIETLEDGNMVEELLSGQNDRVVMMIHEKLKNEPKVRWKDSYRDVIEGA